MALKQRFLSILIIPGFRKEFEKREEEWQHATLHFANGALGFFNWSSIAYDLALRWQRSSRFFAERGHGN